MLAFSSFPLCREIVVCTLGDIQVFKPRSHCSINFLPVLRGKIAAEIKNHKLSQSILILYNTADVAFFQLREICVEISQPDTVAHLCTFILISGEDRVKIIKITIFSC